MIHQNPKPELKTMQVASEFKYSRVYRQRKRERERDID